MNFFLSSTVGTSVERVCLRFYCFIWFSQTLAFNSEDRQEPIYIYIYIYTGTAERTRADSERHRPAQFKRSSRPRGWRRDVDVIGSRFFNVRMTHSSRGSLSIDNGCGCWRQRRSVLAAEQHCRRKRYHYLIKTFTLRDRLQLNSTTQLVW